MRYLMSQPEFEAMLGMQEPLDKEPIPNFIIVYFTATWCGACRRLDLERLESAVSEATWYKCDVDQNNYTPGYCSVRAIPAFVAILNKKVVGTFQNNDTDKVIAWAKGLAPVA